MSDRKMYSGFSLIDDRFGFRTAGSFNCSYKAEKAVITVGVISILALAVLTGAFYLTAAVFHANSGTIEVDHTNILGMKDRNFLIFGSLIPGVGLMLFLLFILLIAFVAILAVLRNGKKYTFSADEEKFVIYTPYEKNRKIAIPYQSVISVSANERRLFFFIHGMDIRVETNAGAYAFEYLHTPASKAEGLSATPFNIIMQRAGIAPKPDLLYKDLTF